MIPVPQPPKPPEVPRLYKIPENRPPVPGTIPLLGTPERGYYDFQQQQQRRKQWFFDTNNQSQVNSVADVVMNTVSSLSRGDGFFEGTANAIETLITDSLDLVHYGTIKPAMERDFVALANNAYVNVIETIDTVDNLYKGYYYDGKEGIHNVVHERQNYHFDTGHRGKDMLWEMLTPTNVALMGMWAAKKGLAGGLAKALGPEDAAKVGNKTIRAIEKAHRGNMGRTLKEVARHQNLSQEAIDLVMGASVHANNLWIIGAINQMAVPIRAVDMIGPKLTFHSTVSPLWQTAKFGVKSVDAQWKYAVKAFERVIGEDPNVMSIIGNQGKLYQEMTSMHTAFSAMGEEIPLRAIEEQVAIVSKREQKQLIDLFRDMSKLLKDEKAIRALGDEHANRLGRTIPFEEAMDIYTANMISDLPEQLNLIARRMTNGKVQNFDEYHRIITQLYYNHQAGTGIKGLYDITDRLHKLRDTTIQSQAVSKLKTSLETFAEAESRAGGIHETIVENFRRQLNESTSSLKETQQNHRKVIRNHNKAIASGQEALNDQKKLLQSAKEKLKNLDNKAGRERLVKQIEKYKKEIDKVGGTVNQTRSIRELLANARKQLELLDNTSGRAVLESEVNLRSARVAELDSILASSRKAVDDYIEIQGLVLTHKGEYVEYDFMERMESINSLLRNDEILAQEAMNTLEGQQAIAEVFDEAVPQMRRALATVRDALRKDLMPLVEGGSVHAGLKQVYDDVSLAIMEIDDVLKSTINAKEKLESIGFAVDSLNDGVKRIDRLLDIPSSAQATQEYFQRVTHAMGSVSDVIKKIEGHKATVTKEFTEAVVTRKFFRDGKLNRKALQAHLNSEHFEWLREDGMMDSLFKMSPEELNIPHGLYNDLLEVRDIMNLLYRTESPTPASVAQLFDDLQIRGRNILNALDNFEGHSLRPEELGDVVHRVRGTASEAQSSYKNLAEGARAKGLALMKEADKIDLKPSPMVDPSYWKLLQEQKEDLIRRAEEQLGSAVRNKRRMTEAGVEVTKSKPRSAWEMSTTAGYHDGGWNPDFAKIKSMAEAVIDMVEVDEGIILSMSGDMINKYRFQLSHLYRNLMILNDGDVKEVLDLVEYHGMDDFLSLTRTLGTIDMKRLNSMKTILDNDGIEGAAKLYKEISGRDLAGGADQIMKMYDEVMEIKTAAAKVTHTLEGMVSTRRLIDTATREAIKGNIEMEVVDHLLDAIQGFYNKPATATDSPDDLGAFLWAIKNNVNMQLRNKNLKHNYKLEKMQDFFKSLAEQDPKFKKEYDVFLEKFPGDAAHFAGADAYADYLVGRYLLDDLGRSRRAIHVDLETNSTNKMGALIHQYSMVNPETGQTVVFINTRVGEGEGLINDGLYRKLYAPKGSSHEGKSIEELKEFYNKVHNNRNSRESAQAIYDWYGMDPNQVQLIPVAGEDELLRQANRKLSDMTSTGDYKLSMYNGRDYDVDVINNRLRLHDIEEGHINRNQILDNRLQLEEMHGVRRLNEQESEVIDNIIYEYLEIRDNELTNLLDDPTAIDKILRGNPLRKFMAAPDEGFRDSLDTIMRYVQESLDNKAPVGEMVGDYNFGELITDSNAGNIVDGMTRLGKLRTSVSEMLTNIRDVNRKLGQFTIDNDPGRQATILSEAFWKDIPKEMSSRGNIMVELQNFFSEAGMTIPIINVKKIQDQSLVTSWFNVKDKPLSPPLIQRMTDFARRIERTISGIKHPMPLALYTDGTTNSARALRELQEMQDVIIGEMRRLSGTSYFSPVYETLNKSDNIIGQYAITQYLYENYAKMINDLKFVNELDPKLKLISKDRLLNILSPKSLREKAEIITDDARFFELNVGNNGDMQEVITYVKEKASMSMKTLESLRDLQSRTINTAKLKKMVPVYEPLLKSLNTLETAVDQSGGNKQMLYKHLRAPFEMADGILAYQKVKFTLSLPPQEMAAYLWNYALSETTFKATDLLSGNYFRKSRGIQAMDLIKDDSLLETFSNIKKNFKDYEAMGIRMEETMGRIRLYLDPDMIDLYKNLDAPNINADFDYMEVLGKFVDNMTDEVLIKYKLKGPLKKALQELQEARRHLISLSPDARTSTLEKMDMGAFERVRYNYGYSKAKTFTMDQLLEHRRFDGHAFNHSVLGSIDSRRELMEFSSFNPAKRMFNAAEFMQSRIATQTQYIELMFDEGFMLKNMTDGMNTQEIFEYMKKNKHLKLAFLKEDKQYGFKLATVNIFKEADIEWAKGVNAVVLDDTTYLRAYEVINRHRIPEGFVKMLDRTLVSPYKLGWMAYNPGTVVRNYIDSNLKNIIATGDLEVVAHTHMMKKHYLDYKHVIRKIKTMMVEDKLSIDAAIELYFEGKAPAMDRELFDFISYFKKNGPSSGQVRELQKYYGDSIQRLYRNAKLDELGVDVGDFRKYIIRPDKHLAEVWAKQHYANNPDTIAKLMEAKEDFYIYKRSWAMHQQYKGQDISVDDLILWQRRPDKLPERFKGIYDDLLRKTEDMSYHEDLIDKIMGSPLVDNALTIHGGVEEAIRLGMYSYMIKVQGIPIEEAMAAVRKTHFDFSHKNPVQMYLEMVMPFSTFRFNSIMFWVDALSRSNTGMEVLGKYMGHAANLENRDVDDIMLRRGLQYQIYTGNLVINEQTGSTLKTNLSAVDSMRFFADPVSHIRNSLHSVGDNVIRFVTMEPYENENHADFLTRKQRVGMQLIPLVGSQLARLKQDPDASPLWNMLFGSFVNKTWTPGQRVGGLWREYPPIAPRGSYQRQFRGTRYRRFFPRRSAYRRQSNYTPFNRIYYGALYNARGNNTNMTRTFRSINRWHSETWRRTLSPKGKSKFQLLSFPTNRHTLKMKTTLLRNMVHY